MPNVHEIGYTVADLARRFRVGPDKVRSWIKAGELLALNTSATLCARPRYIVTVEALEQFERRRQAATTPPPKTKRRPRSTAIDYYPN